jgi:hypothetical protein
MGMSKRTPVDEEAAARIQAAAAKNPDSDTARDEFDRRPRAAADKDEAGQDDDDRGPVASETA